MNAHECKSKADRRSAAIHFAFLWCDPGGTRLAPGAADAEARAGIQMHLVHPATLETQVPQGENAPLRQRRHPTSSLRTERGTCSSETSGPSRSQPRGRRCWGQARGGTADGAREAGSRWRCGAGPARREPEPSSLGTGRAPGLGPGALQVLLPLENPWARRLTTPVSSRPGKARGHTWGVASSATWHWGRLAPCDGGELSCRPAPLRAPALSPRKAQPAG